MDAGPGAPKERTGRKRRHLVGCLEIQRAVEIYILDIAGIWNVSVYTPFSNRYRHTLYPVFIALLGIIGVL